MKYSHCIIFLVVLLFTSNSLLARKSDRYMIITNRIICKTEPHNSAADAPHTLTFGSIITVSEKFENETDFDFLEVEGKTKIYIPAEITIKLPSMHVRHDEKKIEFSEKTALPLLYVPKSLAKINSMYTFSKVPLYVKQKMLKDLYAMLFAAKKAGFNLFVANGYKDLSQRIQEYERAIFVDPKQMRTAKPVYSPYATGLIVDITDKKTGADFHDLVKDEKAWLWLHTNSTRYGFKQSGKSYRFEYSGEKIHPRIRDTPSFPEKINEKVSFGNICKIHVIKNGSYDKSSFIWVHHNEKSAGKTLKYALSKYKGHGVYIINSDKRNLFVPYQRRYYFVDPNRIFTDNGVDKYLITHHPKLSARGRRALRVQIRNIRTKILSSLDWSENKYMIALHSSRPKSTFSIEEYNEKNSYLTYSNPDQNPKNLFFTTSLQDYYFFKSKEVNVVYQRSIDDDGSLSIYAAKHNLPYINIEVEEGYDDAQEEMLNLAIECINQQFKEKSL